MADYDDYKRVSFSSSTHSHNILILFGIENYSIWVIRMRFSFGNLQAVRLIKADPPRAANRSFLIASVKLTGQTLSLMTSKIGDTTMDLAGGADTVKELWSRLHSQYHEKGWGAKSILFKKLVHLRYADCKGTGDYIGKFHALSQRLANIRRIYKNWWLVYLLFSGFGNEHSTWATLFCNASQKEADPPLLNIVTLQLLDKSRLITKPRNTQSNIALFGLVSKKRRFNSYFPTQSNQIKSTYSKVYPL